jgi:oligopeptidase B
VAFTLDIGNTENLTGGFKNLSTGKILPRKLENVGDIVFGAEHIVFYTESDAYNRPYKVVKLNLDSGESECIFTDDDPTHYLDIAVTKDKKYVIIASNTKEDSEVWVMERSANTNEVTPKKLFAREKNVSFNADHLRDFFVGITRRDKKMKILKLQDN